MVKVTRFASHSGSWYSSNPLKLSNELDGYLKKAPDQVPGARFLIGPHAGYSYAGPTLAETYGIWDSSEVKRIFILGPSHHVYFKNVALVSQVDEYETPFGNLPVDKQVVNDLIKHDVFKPMDIDIDEDEHSFEMHAPFIFKLTKDLPQGTPTIIPIMLSHSSGDFDHKVSKILSKYLKDKENTFVISSDFCHWGSRFRYSKYTPSGSLDDLTSFTSSSSKVPADGLPIYKSIEFLDKAATKVASTGSSADWKKYIKLTGNTICGQHPFAILLETLEIVREKEKHDKDWAKFAWIGYAQSSRVTHPSDSSVSYCSGYAVA